MAVRLSPSVMCVHAWELREHIAAFEQAGVAAIHFDVMDGHFVDNIMLGTSFYRDITELTSLPADIHLMCHRPERYLTFFNPREGDWVSFHSNAMCDHPYRLLQQIRERGAKAGLVLDPGTPLTYIEEAAELLDFVLVMAVNPGFAGQVMVPGAIRKIARVRDTLARVGSGAYISVDGNTSIENGIEMVRAGAECLVVGTASGLLGRGAENFLANYESYAAKVRAPTSPTA